jgi:hypothetical protein
MTRRRVAVTTLQDSNEVDPMVGAVRDSNEPNPLRGVRVTLAVKVEPFQNVRGLHSCVTSRDVARGGHFSVLD